MYARIALCLLIACVAVNAAPKTAAKPKNAVPPPPKNEAKPTNVVPTPVNEEPEDVSETFGEEQPGEFRKIFFTDVDESKLSFLKKCCFTCWADCGFGRPCRKVCGYRCFANPKRCNQKEEATVSSPNNRTTEDGLEKLGEEQPGEFRKIFFTDVDKNGMLDVLRTCIRVCGRVCRNGFCATVCGIKCFL